MARALAALLALGLLALLPAGCEPGADIEPIPAPAIPADRVAASAVADAKGWVTVVGLPGAVGPERFVSLTNRTSGAAANGRSDAAGAFALSVAARPGDRLRVDARGFQPFDLVAVAPGAGAPAAPDRALLSVSAVTAEGLVTVTGAPGAVAPDAVVIAAAAAGDAVVTGTADGQGGFSVTLGAAPGEAIVLFARRGGAASPAVQLRAPTGTDADQDGADATVDCDDTDPRRAPGAPEGCNGLDDDCDGIIDEGCGAQPCATDADCAAGARCVNGVCAQGGDPADTDGDGIPNEQDLCPGTADPGQPDGDDDGIGDACDADADNDGSAAGSDCDDRDPLRAPSHPELCGDGVDNDCDQEVDEGCGALPCLADLDCPAGSFCDAATGVCTGLPPETDADDDGSPAGADCDDQDASAAPTLPERCGDGVDNDCDGATDEGC